MTLQIGLIGTGGFSRFHGKILSGMEGVRVKAVLGTEIAKAEKEAALYPDASAYGRLEDMLDREALDAVYICVPPAAHGSLEMKLIERSIPFLVEKPLGVNADGPGRILERIEQTGLITSAGYHFRYMDCTERAAKWLRGKTIAMALGYWMGGLPGVYWWRQQSLSGGQFNEQTTHIVDLLRYLAGEADEVFAAFANRTLAEANPPGDVADVGSVTMKLQNGALATVSNTCVLPEGGLVGLTFYTTEGTAELYPDRIVIKEKGKTLEFRNRTDPYAMEHQVFLHAVKTGDRSGIRSDYQDAYRTQLLTDAAQQSAASGRSIRVNTH